MSTKVLSLVWYSTIKGSAKRLVMLALADRADDQGFCRPGVKNLMLKTGLTDRSIRRAFNDLEEEKLLSRRTRRKISKNGNVSLDTNAYRINLEALRASQHKYDDTENADLATLFDDESKDQNPPDTMSGPLRTQRPQPSGHNVRTPPDTASPYTSVGTSVNPSPLSSPHNKAGKKPDGQMDVSEKEEKPSPTPESPSAARAVLERVKWGNCKAPTKAQARDLETAITNVVTDGWTYAQVETHINTAVTEVRDPKKVGRYVLGALTEYLPMQPPTLKQPRNRSQIATGATENSIDPRVNAKGAEAARKALRAAKEPQIRSKQEGKSKTPKSSQPEGLITV